MTGKTKTCRGCGRDFSAGELFCPDDGSRLSSASQAHNLDQAADPLIGMTLDGRYRVLRAIGEGGMGVVYEAEHVLIEKRVALKVLRETFTRRPDVVERFRQEAKSASRIGHPNIVDVSDCGETPSGASYIVMEMLQGEDLADVLSRECALSPMRASLIVYQVARALDAAHKKGIIHRDLKPENIYLIEREGQPDFVKVVDFGVAKMSDIETLGGRKLTRTGMIFGTPEYMSPEHSAGKQLDQRVDVYALGIILYELLTGRVPFEGDNFMEVLAKHGRDPVPALRDMNPGTRASEELVRVVYKALEKDPDARYQSMLELAGDLRTVPEMPTAISLTSLVPPEWARSAPPPPPAATSTAPLDQPARRKSRWGLSPRHARALGIGFAVLAGGTAILMLWWPSGDRAVVTSLPTPEASVSPAKTIAPQALAATAPAAPPELAAQRPAEPGTVAVRLSSQPPGAAVGGEGLGVLCEATPCEVSLPRGREVTLHAIAGGLSAEKTIVLDQPTDVAFALSSPVVPARPRPVKRRDATELKVPAIFKADAK